MDKFWDAVDSNDRMLLREIMQKNPEALPGYEDAQHGRAVERAAFLNCDEVLDEFITHHPSCARGYGVALLPLVCAGPRQNKTRQKRCVDLITGTAPETLHQKEGLSKWTALHYAYLSEDEGLVLLLRDLGADEGARDTFGRIPEQMDPGYNA